MSAKKNNTSVNPCGLTSREIEIAVFAWKCVDGDGKIDKQKLANLASIGQADSAARMWRGIKAKITAAPGDAPGTPTAGNGGVGGLNTPGGTKTGIDASVANGSPSVRAAEKRAAASAGRKRPKKEVKGEEGSDAEDGARPKKAAKRVPKNGNPANKEPADGVIKGADADEMEAGEV